MPAVGFLGLAEAFVFLAAHSNIILLRMDGQSANLQTGSTGIDAGRRELEDPRLGGGLLFLRGDELFLNAATPASERLRAATEGGRFCRRWRRGIHD